MNIYEHVIDYCKNKYFKYFSLIFFLYLVLSIFTYEDEYKISSSINPTTPTSNALTTLISGASDETFFDFTDVVYSNYVLNKFLNESWLNIEINESELQNAFTYYNNTDDSDLSQETLNRETVDSLRNDLKVTKSRLTGLILLEIETSDVVFGNLFLSFVQNESVNYINQLKSGLSDKKITFLSKRLSQIENELNISEEDLKIFLDKNKNYSSPELQIEYLRLKRQVEINSALLKTITSQLEVARIQRLDNVPDFVILDEPYISEVSTLPSEIIFKILSFILINTFFGLFGLYLRLSNE